MGYKLKMADPSRTFYDPATGLYLNGADAVEVDQANVGGMTKVWIREGGIIEIKGDASEAPTPVVETSTQKPAEAPAPTPEPDPLPENAPGPEEDEEPSLSDLLTPKTKKK
jgi:hypothetical protein